MISVRDALELPALSSCRLLAGESGLDRRIRYVTIMDAPDIALWLRGGELLLCNIYVIRDDVDKQVRLVSDCYESEAAALGVKTRRFVDGLPEDMLKQADRLGLPVVEIPEEYAWVDVMHPLLTHIINRQHQRLVKSADLHHRFTNLALRGVGLGEITRVLASLTGYLTVMVDENLEVRHAFPAEAFSGEHAQGLNRLKPFLRRRPAPADGGRNVVTIPRDELGPAVSALASTIAPAEDCYGWFVCFPTEGSRPRSEDRMAMEYAATVAALEVVKSRAIAQVKRSFRNDFLFDLLHGKMRSEEIIRSRARGLGWELSRTYGLITMEVEQLHHSGQGSGTSEASIFRSASLSARRVDSGSLVMQIGGSVAVLLPELEDEEKILAAARKIKRFLERNPEASTVTVGAGRTYGGLSQLADSFQEAERALNLGRMVWGPGSVTHYNQLGMYRILLSSDGAELSMFMEEFLGPVLAKARGGDRSLMDTLEAFFDADEEVTRAAGQLFVHPNTVRYRLRKVQELTGLDLSRTQDRVNLEVALKIARYLKAGRE